MGNRIDVASIGRKVKDLAPGVALATVITLVALVIGALQEQVFDYAVLEPLVLALIMGIAVRAFWSPRDEFLPGIGFAAKQMLEFAIVLLGA